MKKFFINILTPTFEQHGPSFEDIKHHYAEYNIYVLSCFMFILAGLIKINRNVYGFGILLIFQSFLSYMNDVHTLGKISRWHLIDRYYATTMSIYHLYSIRKSNKTLFINGFLFLIGIKYLNESQTLYSKHSTKFMIAHAKWHLVAPIMTLTS
jgi:hypothetical protein